jgi:glutathione S-transferase
MSLTLYFHPLASFCWKALIALYENDTPFTPVIVDLADERSRGDFFKVWPIGKFPVLRDDARGQTIPESTIIIEYLARHFPGRSELVPADTELALEARLKDRVYDFYVHEPMQKIVTDRLRPLGKNDPHGVELAKAQLKASYAVLDAEMATREWAAGDRFTLADCAAAPALYYANEVLPFTDEFRNLGAYVGRLKARPSFARVLDEARPYFWMVPKEPAFAG